MRRLTGFSLALLLTLTWSSILVRDASALPQFARKYGVNCNKCHTQFSELNSDGVAFKQNGYRQPDEVGNVIWEEDVMPLGALFKIRYNFTDVDKKSGPDPVKKSFFDPHELELFGAGTLAPGISYFWDAEMKTSGKEDNSAKDEPFRINAFYVQFNDLLKSDGKLNLKAGRLRNEYLHHSDHNRLTWEHYLWNPTMVGDGVELNGLLPVGEGAVHYALGVINDNTGITKVDNNFRANYSWATYTLSGQTVGVRYTRIPTRRDQKTGAPPTEINTTFDAFIKLNTQFGENPAHLILGYAQEKDVGGVSGKDRTNYLVQPTFFLGDKWLFLGRYEIQDDRDIRKKNSQWLVQAAYVPYPNAKILAEFHRKTKKETADREIESRLRVGIIFAF